MKKILATTLLGTSALGFATEEENLPQKSYYHCVSPKAFFRYHNEENYNYKIYGGGFEYSFLKPQGINLNISFLTNGKSSEVLIESEHALSYKFPVGSCDYFYPIMSTRQSAHKIREEEQKNVYIHKSTTFLGLGWEWYPEENLRVKLEATAFRDMHNALVILEEDKFWGNAFYNPFGWKGKIGFASNPIKENMFFEVEGYYAQTFKKCYEESGVTLALKWGF